MVLTISSSGAGAKGFGGPRLRAARLEHRGRGGHAGHLEDLRPAVAEPAVADDQHRLPAGELARHRLHAVAAAAGHHHRCGGAVNLLQAG
jgi:hypothetical protein